MTHYYGKKIFRGFFSGFITRMVKYFQMLIAFFNLQAINLNDVCEKFLVSC